MNHVQLAFNPIDPFMQRHIFFNSLLIKSRIIYINTRQVLIIQLHHIKCLSIPYHAKINLFSEPSLYHTSNLNIFSFSNLQTS